MTASTLRSLGAQDLDAVADIHQKAFVDRALSSLGWEAVRRYYRWQLLGPHEAVALGIFQEDRLAGFCFAGIFRQALTGFLRKNKGFLAWQVFTHPWLIRGPLFRERIHLAWNIVGRRSHAAVAPTPVQRTSFGILSIAVDPKMQGRGLGKQLMGETETVAKARGFSHLHLSVDAANTRAISFYEKLNWHKATFNAEWRGLMVKDLDIHCE